MVRCKGGKKNDGLVEARWQKYAQITHASPRNHLLRAAVPQQFANFLSWAFATFLRK